MWRKNGVSVIDFQAQLSLPCFRKVGKDPWTASRVSRFDKYLKNFDSLPVCVLQAARISISATYSNTQSGQKLIDLVAQLLK